MLIRRARAAEMPALQAIEVEAGRAFVDVDMAEVARDEPLPAAELERFRAAGGAWVAADDDGAPVAYLICAPLDGAVHVEQVSVRPDHARRGIGRALIERVAEQARADGVGALTLTTFTDVPWNAPYYERLGFTVIPDGEVTEGLRAVRAEEAAHGLDRWPRVCMRREL